MLKEMIKEDYLKSHKTFWQGKTYKEAGKEVDKFVNKFIDAQSHGQLQDVARQQVLRTINDYIPKDMGRKISAVQAFNHLQAVSTFMRNIFSNSAFNSVEKLSNTLAWGTDSLIQKSTYC